MDISEYKEDIDELVLFDISGLHLLLDVLSLDDEFLKDEVYLVSIDKKGDLHLTSDLVPYIKLKGRIDDEDYERMKRIWNFNVEITEESKKHLKLYKRQSKLKSIK